MKDAGGHDGHPPPHRGEGLGHLGARRGIEIRVQFKIKTREFDLPQRIERRIERARAEQALQHVDGQRFAAVDVRGYERQHLGAPDEVFHELARQLDRVPGHAVDPGDAGIGHPRQHVVQPVAEFVKQRGHLVVRQHARAAAPTGAVKLHTSCATGSADARRQGFGDDAFVHPCAAALLGARIRIEKETGDDALVLIEQIVVAHAGMPNPDSRPFTHADAVEAPNQREQAGQHLGQREIGTQRFLRHLVAAFLQPLAVEGHVPGVELAARKFFEIREFLARRRQAAPRQVIQKAEHLLAALRHARGQRVVGKVLKTQQAAPARAAAAGSRQ